jgi:predicted DNA-binding ribbon-helix-helix protein
MRSPVIKRSIVIAGHKTSVSLEDPFWKGLNDIAAERRTTLSALVAAIDSERQHGNLSSAIRLFVLDHFQARGDHHGGGADRPAGRGNRPDGERVQTARAAMMVTPAAVASLSRPE